MRFKRSAARAALLAACAVSFMACEKNDGAQSGGPPTVVLNSDTTSADLGVVDVMNLDASLLHKFGRARPTLEQWHEVLSVRVAADSNGLPLLGDYDVERDRIRFRPRFAPARGQMVHVRFDGAALQRISGVAGEQIASIDTTWQVSERPGEASTMLVQIYPTSDRLPVNLLRIYLHFSAPMSMGEAYSRVHVVADNGQEVRDAFLVVAGEKELWDPEHKRLTLLFDPGRIKRDLRPNLEAGLPLREGHEFAIVVDSVWQDAQGKPLRSSFRKQFTVVAADRVSPRAQNWKLTPPPAGGRAELTLRFPEPLDEALLRRLVSVRGVNGVVPGSVTIDESETRWRFVPDTPWQAGSYTVDVGTELEDVAGNSLRRLFDVDRKATPVASPTGERVQIPFRVR